MNSIRHILFIVCFSLCFVGCLDMKSNTSESKENTSDIYVYISSSDLKKIYISVPKETASINVCILASDLKTCKNNNKQLISKEFQKRDDRKIFEFSNTETGSKAFGIDRVDKDGKVATRLFSFGVSNSDLKYADDEWAPNPEGVALSKDEFDMIVALNKYRKSRGLNVLKVSKSLMEGAREQSQAMKSCLMQVTGGKYSYSYPMLESECQKHKMAASNAAENIFLIQKGVNEAMSGFKNSTHGHNEQMLGPFKYIGVANAPDYAYGCWTQRFSSSPNVH